MIAVPLLAGATKATEICALPRVRIAAAGALGTAAGTAEPEAADAVPFPATLVASTVHVYVLPFVSDDTTIGDEEPAFEPALPPSLEVQPAV